MSILIKGMEMPKDIEPGLVIEFADGIDGKRYARLYHYRHGGLTEWLEAVPVPPHGRLIDADAAAKQGWTINRTYSATPTEMVYEVKTMTDEVLPTIIEADIRDNNVGNIPAEEDE